MAMDNLEQAQIAWLKAKTGCLAILMLAIGLPLLVFFVSMLYALAS